MSLLPSDIMNLSSNIIHTVISDQSHGYVRSMWTPGSNRRFHYHLFENTALSCSCWPSAQLYCPQTSVYPVGYSFKLVSLISVINKIYLYGLFTVVREAVRLLPHGNVPWLGLACQVALDDSANKVFSKQKQIVLEEMCFTPRFYFHI